MPTRIDLARRGVMGILNVTPDSFSDGGLFSARDAAVARAFEIAAEGALVLDVGGESTRPRAEPTALDEERRRVLPVLEELERRRFPIPVSIDTRKAALARDALARGAGVVNDVSALGDPDMAEVVASSGALVVLMHMKGTPATMQEDPRYEDVVSEVARFLEERRARAIGAGVAPHRILVDPGIGFGKTAEHNWILLADTARFARIAPVVVGVSRKSFLAPLVRGSGPEARTSAGIGVALAAFARGATLVRTHDVRATVEALAGFERVADNPPRGG
jgi:dihydropteroate synthase